MRKLRYSFAASLDGYIAAPDGSYDWIVTDPALDFAALFAEFDTLLMGRKTWEVASKGLSPSGPHQVIVASRTMSQPPAPGVRLLRDDLIPAVAALKAQPGKDIWLFGGGNLARPLFDAHLVDTVEVALIPVLLGDGIPLLAPGPRVTLSLESARSLTSGIQLLKYLVQRSA